MCGLHILQTSGLVGGRSALDAVKRFAGSTFYTHIALANITRPNHVFFYIYAFMAFRSAVLYSTKCVVSGRVKDMQAIGPVETKLLYTMQWILLYAAEECADDEGGDDLGLAEAAEPKPKAMDQYLFSVPTITVSSNC